MITRMKCPNKSSIDDSATLRTIASILTSYITGNHTSFQTNIAVMLHGLTKSREVVDVMHQHGLGVSYDEVLMVRDFGLLMTLNDHCTVLSKLLKENQQFSL